MKKIFSVIIVIMIVFFSCNEEDSLFPEKLEDAEKSSSIKIDSTLGFTVLVKNNTLHFPKSSDVFKALDILSNISPKERRVWEKSIGFTSFQTIYEDIKSEIIEDEKGDKFEEILRINKAFIKKADECYLSIQPRVYGKYALITNSLGYYISQAYVQKIYDGKLYSGYIYDLPAVAAKSHEDEITPPFDLSQFEIDVLVLDEQEAYNYKSYIEPEYANAYSGVRFRMGDESNREDWDKKARFTMGLKNYYVASSVAQILTFTKYYYVVYCYCDYDPYAYDCGDCPGGYSGYADVMGNWYQFVKASGSEYWKVEVPYIGYFNNYPGVKPPDGEHQTYITEIYEKRYYNWTGRVDVTCEFEAEHMSWFQWREYNGTVLKLTNIEASVKIGYNNSGYSFVVEGQINPFNFNLSEKVGEHFRNYSQTAYHYTLSKYESKPVARFECITGDVYVRFCPYGTYHMNYNF